MQEAYQSCLAKGIKQPSLSSLGFLDESFGTKEMFVNFVGNKDVSGHLNSVKAFRADLLANINAE